MPQYLPKNELVQGAELQAQRLAIPLQLVGNATAASVTLRSDQPGFVFMRSSSVDQITAALAESETATFSASPNDATGVFQVLIAISESVSKVFGARLTQRDGANAQYAYLGSSTGITTGSGGGQKIMLLCDSSVDLTGANTANLLLEVTYSVAE